MIENLKNIFTKLNRLNTNIVFFYYHKYLSDGHFSSIAKIDLQDFYDSRDVTDKTERYILLKTELPYYYKMLNLYAHMVSIIENSYGKLSIIYDTVQDNFINNLDDPQDMIEQILFDMTEDTFSDLKDDVLQEKNKELKILMRNANSLNSDLKKYYTNEHEFCKNSNLNDYKYMSQDEDTSAELEQKIADLTQQVELRQQENKLAHQLAEVEVAKQLAQQLAQQAAMQQSQGIIPATMTSLISPPDAVALENELKYLSNLNDMGLLSNRDYHDRVSAAMLNHNQTQCIKLATQKPPVINNTTLYDKLMKMNPMVDDGLVKKILESNKDEKE